MTAHGRVSVRVPVIRALARWVSGGPRVRHSVRQAVGCSLLATVCLAVAPGVRAGAPAGADQVGNLSSPVQADEAQINADAAHIHDLTVAYDQASTQASAFAQQVQGTAAQLTALQDRVAGTERTIRHEAVLAYTGQVSSSPEIATANPTQIGVGQMYLRSIAGDFGDTLDALHLQQREVTSVQSTLHDVEQAQRHQVTEAAAARQQALDQAAAAQQLLNQTQAELVSAQQAAAWQHAGQHPAAPGAEAQQAGTPPQAQAPAHGAPQANAAAAPQGPPVGNSLVQMVASALSGAAGSSDGQLARLRQCESGGNYQANSGNGYYGAYQLSQAAWSSLGLRGRPDQASPAVQDRAVLSLTGRSGWSQWPTCSALLGIGG